MRRSTIQFQSAQEGRSNLQKRMQSSRHRHSVEKARSHDFVFKQTVGTRNCVHGETFDVHHACERKDIKVLVQSTKTRTAVNNVAQETSKKAFHFDLPRLSRAGHAPSAATERPGCEWTNEHQ